MKLSLGCHERSCQKYSSDHDDLLCKTVLNRMTKCRVSARRVTCFSSLIPDHSPGSIIQYSKLFNMLLQASAIPMLPKPSSLQDVVQASLFMKPSLISTAQTETDAPSAVFSQPLCQTSHMQYGIVTVVYFPSSHTLVRIL